MASFSSGGRTLSLLRPSPEEESERREKKGNGGVGWGGGGVNRGCGLGLNLEKGENIDVGGPACRSMMFFLFFF